MNPLTVEQAYFVRRQVSRWLDIKERFEIRDAKEVEKLGRTEHGDLLYRKVGEPAWPRFHFSQLRADVDHSALLVRLLVGKEPLEVPPPLANAYPVYGDD